MIELKRKRTTSSKSYALKVEAAQDDHPLQQKRDGRRLPVSLLDGTQRPNLYKRISILSSGKTADWTRIIGNETNENRTR